MSPPSSPTKRSRATRVRRRAASCRRACSGYRGLNKLESTLLLAAAVAPEIDRQAWLFTQHVKKDPDAAMLAADLLLTSRCSAAGSRALGRRLHASPAPAPAPDARPHSLGGGAATSVSTGHECTRTKAVAANGCKASKQAAKIAGQPSHPPETRGWRAAAAPARARAPPASRPRRSCRSSSRRRR